MANTPPLLTATSNFTLATTATRTLPSINVVAGQVLVIKAAAANTPATISISNAGGQTWTLQQSVVVSSRCTVYIWTAIANTTGDISVELTRASTSGYLWAARINAWNSEGVGVSSSTQVSSGAPTLNIDPTGDYSAIEVINADWNPIDGATRTWRTNFGPLSEQHYEYSAGNITYYTGYHGNAGVNPANNAVGLTAPSGQRYSIAALEVFGTTAVTQVEKAGSETHTISINDSSSLLKSISIEDASGASDVFESAVGTVISQTLDDNSGATDSGFDMTVSLSETLTDSSGAIDSIVLRKNAGNTDIGSLSISENTSVFKQIAATDNPSLSIIESNSISSTLSSSDSGQLSIAESIDTHKNITSHDSSFIVVDEEETRHVQIYADDESDIIMDESQSIDIPTKIVKAYHDGEWAVGTTKAFINGEWRVVSVKYWSGDIWS